MTATQPTITIDARYGNPGAQPRPWSEAEALLEKAEIYWLTTVRAGGRPHVTPLIALWIDGALYFTTGDEEQKALNLAANQQCAVTTGCNLLNEGLDIVIEGVAKKATGQEKLQRVADNYQSKYGWTFHAREGQFYNDDHGGKPVLLFEVVPSRVYGFGKGEPYSQTRWQFD